MMNIQELKEFLVSEKNLQICILDNNTIEFLLKIKEEVSSDKLLGKYSLIIIPKWVEEEIKDSKYRKSYVDDLSLKYSMKVVYMDEKEYSSLINFLEGDLFRLFMYSVYNLGEVKSFINRNILQGKDIEDLEEYEEWIHKLYNEGLAGKKLSNGRVKRKNAGEISICVLSYILAYYYFDNIENITILSHDNDCYDFVATAGEKLSKDEKFKIRKKRTITFKSNDVLLYEVFNKKLVFESKIQELIDRVRQERYVRFTRKKLDDSIELQHVLINNEEFYEIIKDEFLHMIF